MGIRVPTAKLDPWTRSTWGGERIKRRATIARRDLAEDLEAVHWYRDEDGDLLDAYRFQPGLITIDEVLDCYLFRVPITSPRDIALMVLNGTVLPR